MGLEAERKKKRKEERKNHHVVNIKNKILHAKANKQGWPGLAFLQAGRWPHLTSTDINRQAKNCHVG